MESKPPEQATAIWAYFPLKQLSLLSKPWVACVEVDWERLTQTLCVLVTVQLAALGALAELAAYAACAAYAARSA